MTWSGRQMMGNARAITGQDRSLAPRPLTGQALLVPYGEACGFGAVINAVNVRKPQSHVLWSIGLVKAFN